MNGINFMQKPIRMMIQSSPLLLGLLLITMPAFAGTTPERSISNTVETLCPILAGENRVNPLTPVQQDLLFRCGEVKINTSEGQTFDDLSAEQFQALGHMTAEETDTMETLTVEFFKGQTSVIMQRMAAVRSGTATVSHMKNRDTWPAVLLAGPVSVGSLTENPPEFADSFGKLGVFLSGNLATGDRDATRIEPGFDFDSWGLTGGADYRLTPNLVLGAAFGYAETEAEIDENAGDVDVDGYVFSLYGTYYLDRFYIDVIGSYGVRDYDTVRNVQYGINVNPDDPDDPDTIIVDQSFHGSADADEYAFSVGAGYEMVKKNITYGPYARVRYVNTEIDSYQERLAAENTNPGFGLPLSFEDQDITSLSSALGVHFACAISTQFGVLVLHLRADWTHEFDNDTDAIRAEFIHGSATAEASAANVIIIPVEDPDENFFNLGVGMSTVLPRGMMAYLDYTTILGLEDISFHQLTGGIRLEF